jgi:hypothetical protein
MEDSLARRGSVMLERWTPLAASSVCSGREYVVRLSSVVT